MRELIRHILREHTSEIREMRKITTPEFIQKAQVIHGDRYDYSEVDYQGTDKDVNIICPEHGVFPQSPHSHLHGRGCPICGGNQKKDNEKFISQAIKIHGDKYDYSKTDYKGARRDVIITCPIHGDFPQQPSHHLNGHGCKKCAAEERGKERRKPVEDFIKQAEQIHNDKYDYSKVTGFTSNKNSVIITCPIHGDFPQSPNSHLRGRGCPICKESQGEKFIANLLTKKKITFNRQHRFDDCTNKFEKFCVRLPFDFYLPNFNSIIEYDGVQHFKPSFGERSYEITQRNDKLKNRYAKSKKIKLIRIPYTMNKEDIEPYILKELGIEK